MIPLDTAEAFEKLIKSSENRKVVDVSPTQWQQWKFQYRKGTLSLNKVNEILEKFGCKVLSKKIWLYPENN